VAHWDGIMKSNPIQILVLTGIAGVACVPDFGTAHVELAILGVASSTVAACQFGPGTPPVLSDALVFDLAASEKLRLPLVVRNDWGSTIAVKEMDLSWDCNANGFSPGEGPLFVPSHDLDVPFCRDTHQPNRPFIGWDVVATTGAPIEPGATGVVWVEIVPSALGEAMSESMDLAVLANVCEDGNFHGVDLSSPECQALASRLDEVLPGASINNTRVSRYARYAFADGDFALEGDPNPPMFGTGLRLQLRGLVRGESGNDDIFSNEIIQAVDICRNCGVVQSTTPATRAPRDGFACYYEPATAR
jgi:hypothetical protein